MIDTSAICAILLGEPEADRFIDAILSADSRRLSVANWVEACIVIEARRGPVGLRDLDRLIADCQIQIEPVDVEQGRLARDGYNVFGKGRHPAALNLGDCFAYALAIRTRERLLCKSEDFVRTDVRLFGESESTH